MTVLFPVSPPPNLRVFAKVARTAPSGAAIAAVVRFYLQGGPAPTSVQQSFQFGELRPFLEVARARAAVTGMLSLLPLDLEAECFQAWAGFISSVLSVAALRSMRRNLGGIIGIVRIDGLGVAAREEDDEDHCAGDVGFSSSAPPSTMTSQEVPSARVSETAAGCSAGEDGGGEGGCSWSCPICYEFLMGGGAKATTTPCGHRFHEACIGRWQRSRLTCPVCRSVMPEKVPEKVLEL